MSELGTVGSTFADRFRIVETLAEGEMGAVVVAEQMSGGPRVALKLLEADIMNDDQLAGFSDEVHPGVENDHVVQVVEADVDASTGRPWIAMELLQGEDLQARVTREGPLSPQEMIRIMGAICDALCATHDHGRAHAGLTPENVFLSSEGEVKVRELGFARFMVEVFASQGEVIGDPPWMAPEQFKPGTPATPAADIWTIGLLAFWMLTGRSYWKRAADPNASITAQLREIVRAPLEPASARASSFAKRVPAWFDAWFARCVARAPSERFPDAREALSDLERSSAAVDEPDEIVVAPMVEEPAPVEPEAAPSSATEEEPPSSGLPDEAWLLRVSFATGRPPPDSELPRASVDEEEEEATTVWRSQLARQMRVQARAQRRVVADPRPSGGALPLPDSRPPRSSGRPAESQPASSQPQPVPPPPIALPVPPPPISQPPISQPPISQPVPSSPISEPLPSVPEIQARWDDLEWEEERASSRGRVVSPPPLPALEPIDEDTPESEPPHRIDDDETPDSLPPGPLPPDDMPESEPPPKEHTERMEPRKALKKRAKSDERALEFEEPRRNDMWLLALAVAVAIALWYWLTKR